MSCGLAVVELLKRVAVELLQLLTTATQLAAVAGPVKGPQQQQLAVRARRWCLVGVELWRWGDG